jgi:hypothetical protein
MSDGFPAWFRQVSTVTILAAARFSPKTAVDAALVHTTAFQFGAIRPISSSDQLREWDLSWSVDDGFLAAMMQLLKLETGTSVECLLAAGHRLRRSVLLNLPRAVHEDSSLQCVLQLYAALQLGIASVPIKVWLLPSVRSSHLFDPPTLRSRIALPVPIRLDHPQQTLPVLVQPR